MGLRHGGEVKGMGFNYRRGDGRVLWGFSMGERGVWDLSMEGNEVWGFSYKGDGRDAGSEQDN